MFCRSKIIRVLNRRAESGEWRRAGFSLIEIMACLVIMGVVSSMVMVDSVSTDATERLDRAAQEVLSAVRYARVEATAHGQTVSGTLQPSDAYGVQFNTTADTVTVYHSTWNSTSWSLPGTAVSNPMFSTGTYVLNLMTQPDCAGVTISAVNLCGTTDTSNNTASPYVCQFRPFGRAENYGTITLSYGTYTRTVTIPQVGDASEN